jgi:hypothetical protein
LWLIYSRAYIHGVSQAHFCHAQAVFIDLASLSRASHIIRCSRNPSKYNLPYSHEISTYVCDLCQQAKSHPLHYTISTSVSTVHLEQLFSYVWVPAPIFVRKYSYYVSFIDDFRKFRWICLLKKCYDVYQLFLISNN